MLYIVIILLAFSPSIFYYHCMTTHESLRYGLWICLHCIVSIPE